MVKCSFNYGDMDIQTERVGIVEIMSIAIS